MKRLKQLSMAVVLTLMFALSAFAGDIQIPAPAPPPPGASSEMAPGEIHIGVNSPAAPGDSVTEVALNILQSLLSVF